MKNPLDRVYRDCDRKKKAEYNQRIIDVERGTFTPLYLYYNRRNESGMLTIQQKASRADRSKAQGALQRSYATHSDESEICLAPSDACGSARRAW